MSSRKFWPAVALTVLLATPVLAIEPQMSGDVKYVSGGIGEAEHQEMRTLQSQYPLQLLFAVQGSGEYLADVKVAIKNAQGRTILEAVADGPQFFVDLPAGTYTVTVATDGQAQSRSVKVTPSHATQESFYWSGPR